MKKQLCPDNIERGKRLRYARIQKQISIEEISLALGVASSTYREWENGRAITGNPYPKLSQILGVSAYEILGIETNTEQALSIFLADLEKCLHMLKERVN